MRIPLPGLIRRWRMEAFKAGKAPAAMRSGLAGWAWLARHPKPYRLATAIVARLLRLLAGGKGAIRRLPGLSGWLSVRDLPAPQGRTFMELWKGGNHDDGK